MKSDAARLRRLFILACLLFFGGWAILMTLSFGAAWARNRKALELNRLMVSESEFGSFPDFASLEPAESAIDRGNFASYQRSAGHRHLAAGDRDEAARAFAAAGWDGQDFAAMAEHYFDTDPARAIAWLALASTAGPPDLQIISRLGEACRPDWGLDPACDWFLEQNEGNHFVNPDFAVADLKSWQKVEAPADYVTVNCPGNIDAGCIEIKVRTPESRPPAGVGQCFQIVPGRAYRFSAWLKVTTSPDGVWRPLYFQGVADGETRGNWMGDEQGSSDWTYWERTFVAPAFDDQLACFNPIRLQNAGQAWFRNGEVIALTEGS